MMFNSKNISVLIKLTENCNLRCAYCFHSESGYTDTILNIEDLKKFINLLFSEYNSIKIIWHGGEPLLVGLDYYKEIYNYINGIKKNRNINFNSGIQTNATLLNEEFIKFFIKNKVGIGISFDGLSNELTRSATDKVIEKIHLLKSFNLNIGAISVVSKYNINSLNDEYNYFKKLGVSLQLNKYIPNHLNDNLSISIDEYFTSMSELFNIYIADGKCNINLNPFNNYLKQLITQAPLTCSNGSCLKNWLCINPNGDIVPCDRDFPKVYTYSNIKEISHMSNIYYSIGYRKLLSLAIIRRKKCMETCNLYEYCAGGCNANALVEGGIENNNGNSCKCYYSLFSYVKNFFNNLILDQTKILKKINNPIVLKILNN